LETKLERRKLLASERQQKILEWVASEEAIDYGTLARFFDVSVMTVRRDVRQLVDQGYMTMTRGGATAHLSRSLDILVNPRAFDSSVAKARIGEFAARSMVQGQVIFVGTGSTTARFIQYLNPDQDLTVITPSLPHASYLATRDIRVISTGGLVATEDLAQTGSLAAATISRFHVDLAVIGAKGISRAAGLSEADHEIAELNRIMREHAEKTWILADASKVGLKYPFHASQIDEVTAIVTTHDGVEAFQAEVRGECEIMSSGEPVFGLPVEEFDLI
jgi:DeoR family transcriptional regulator, fructose operon transcriptional repressor